MTLQLEALKWLTLKTKAMHHKMDKSSFGMAHARREIRAGKSLSIRL
jgi:hypothetical protein